MNRQWQNHAFWENYAKDRITGILVITQPDGKKTSQQLTVSKLDDKGQANPDFQEVLDQLGTEQLDKNTQARADKKAEESRTRYLKEQQKKKQEQLAALFDAKLNAFEIPEIKNSKNRELKARLRKSKNIVEMQIFAQLIVKEELGI